MDKPLDLQIVIDCADPHVLADWWAETLGYTVEPQDEAFIRRMIDEGYATDDDTRVYQGRLVWKTGSAILKRADRQAPDQLRILFQLVPEPKAVKNRAHLDIRVDPDDMKDRVDALVARGARVLHTGQQGPHTWTTLSDPEGNEFCVQ
jgi:hypothetical protein